MNKVQELLTEFANEVDEIQETQNRIEFLELTLSPLLAEIKELEAKLKRKKELYADLDWDCHEGLPVKLAKQNSQLVGKILSKYPNGLYKKWWVEFWHVVNYSHSSSLYGE